MNGPAPPDIQVVTDAIAGQAAAEQAIPWVLVTFILFGAAIIAWGITEAVKKTATGKYRYDHKGASAAQAKKSLWWTPMLTLVSIFIGFGVGALIGGFQWSWLYGGFVGAMGGALASFLVSLFKGNITALTKKLIGGKTEEKSE